MEAYTWDELIKLTTISDYDFNVRHELELWLAGFPDEIRPTAALAASVAKWHPQSPSRGLGGTYTCGCCVAYDAHSPTDVRCGECKPGGCPLSMMFPLDRSLPSCIADTVDETYNAILEKYKEAYEKLPAEWRES